MSQVKKMLIVDPAQLNNQATQSQPSNIHFKRQKPLPKSELERLDMKMLEIVDDQSLTDEDKLHAYTQALTKYQNLHSMLKQGKLKPMELNKTSEQATSSSQINTEINKPKNSSMTIGVPKNYQRKASQLLELIRDQQGASIDSKGKLTIKGKLLTDGHISDFINKAVNPGYNYGELEDWDKFQSLLNEIGVPKSLLAKQKSITSRVTSSPVTSPPERTPVKYSTPVYGTPQSNKKRWKPY